VKQITGAAERNKGPIADALVGVLPERGTVLELASGSGQHVMMFAERFPRLRFQPSDPSEPARASIAAHLAETPLANVEPPLEIDVGAPDWPRAVDGVLCINLVQVVPYATIPLLFGGAARCLQPGAPLVLYGPYRRGDDFLSPGRVFDRTLRGESELRRARHARSPAHGMRARASRWGADRDPANNHCSSFEGRASDVP
jgi:hypothetical protein